MNQNKIVIIGGGVSGFITAIELLKNTKHPIKVIILEKNNKFNKKLAVSGNGRCNIGNTNLTANCYNNIPFATKILNAIDMPYVDYLSTLGIFTKEISNKVDNSGWLYPITEQSSSVVDVLSATAKRLGAELRLGEEVISIIKDNAKYTVKTQDNCYYADYVVIACGSPAWKGTDNSVLLKNLGITVQEFEPALGAIKTNKSDIQGLLNIRINTRAKLIVKGNTICEKTGEILFKDDSLSGIMAMQFSRLMGVKPSECYVQFDFVVDLENAILINELKGRLQNNVLQNELHLGITTKGVFDLIKKKTEIKDINIDNLKVFVKTLKNYKVQVIGKENMEHSQIAKGGIELDCVNDDLMLKKHNNMYAVGEALDIDGDCGGYNIMFAVCSGYVCAKAIGDSICIN